MIFIIKHMYVGIPFPIYSYTYTPWDNDNDKVYAILYITKKTYMYIHICIYIQNKKASHTLTL